MLNQVSPSPGKGVARKTKMISAVPTSVRACARVSTEISCRISKSTTVRDPAKMISCPYGTCPSPTTSESATKAAPPIKYHGFARVLEPVAPSRASIRARPMPRAIIRRRRAADCQAARITPETDNSGISNAPK